ncbi:MAG: hypothetical protein M1837_000421 [Sclerophora amabilis]|nr:MAG: hypothetical protein M1837_000421 [Sclerophora amabilis]
MRLSHAPPTLLSLLTILLSTTHSATAKPHPRDVPFAEVQGSSFLLAKRCDKPCGWSGQLCCASHQTCFTDDAGQAQCGSSSGSGGGGGGGGGSGGAQEAAATAQGNDGSWQYFTTTYVETDLVTHTSTYSSMVGGEATQWTPAPTAQGAGCAWDETPCGGTCCGNGRYCQSSGHCVAGAADVSSQYYSSYYSSSQSYSVPLRPTTGGATTATSTASATTTEPFQTPLGTAGGIVYGTGPMEQTNNAGLSGGAIAGIVIGVIAGIILLLLICAACCLRAGFSGLAGLFGMGRRRRRESEETYIHESHHHGGGGPPRPWFGGRPGRVERPPRRTGALGGLGPVAAGLGGLALALGLKRKHDRRHDEKYSSSDSSYSYYDTSSSK